MKEIRRYVMLLSGILLFVLTVSCQRQEEKKPETEIIDFRSVLSDVSELRLAEMSLSKVGRVRDERMREASDVSSWVRAAVNHLKIGARIGVYSYDTYLTASADLSQLRPEDVHVDSAAKVVEVDFPPIQVAYAGRDMELREEHVRVTGLRSAITPRERSELKSMMAASLQRELAANHDIEQQLRQTARASATEFISALAAEHGYTARVTFR
ncbi:MAG: DUF4230 domain-containing protein [Muribaculaceae bacterium]|nr:DUF4230 domain-containing protein [Muribaculaceae bacterium]